MDLSFGRKLIRISYQIFDSFFYIRKNSRKLIKKKKKNPFSKSRISSSFHRIYLIVILRAKG